MWCRCIVLDVEWHGCVWLAMVVAQLASAQLQEVTQRRAFGSPKVRREDIRGVFHCSVMQISEKASNTRSFHSTLWKGSGEGGRYGAIVPNDQGKHRDSPPTVLEKSMSEMECCSHLSVALSACISLRFFARRTDHTCLFRIRFLTGAHFRLSLGMLTNSKYESDEES